MDRPLSARPGAARFVVRPPASEGERGAFLRHAAAHFVRDVPQAVAAADLRRSVFDAPNADPTGIRGAFRGDAYLGGYLIEARSLRIGRARLPTGCVGLVLTHPDHRRQGVATALMRDAAAWARARDLVLLLLHGLADFYRPFGYVDVFDPTDHAVKRDDVLAAEPGPYRVRPVSDADAPALLALYDRHYGPHPGAFERTLEQQAFAIRLSASIARDAYRQIDGPPHAPPVVAVDAGGAPRGYLVPAWGSQRAFGAEVATDDSPAALALLRWQAEQLAGLDEPPAEVRWPLPPDSLAAAFLADRFAVERRSRLRPWAGWEAAVVDAPGLVRAMLPEWNDRWRRHAPVWSGTLALTIDGTTLPLRLDPNGVSLGVDSGTPGHAVTLTHEALLPLLFGFRSVAWAATRPDHAVPGDLRRALGILFPPRTPWIAPSDGC